jgi:hypothetical protein
VISFEAKVKVRGTTVVKSGMTLLDETADVVAHRGIEIPALRLGLIPEQIAGAGRPDPSSRRDGG